MNKSTKDWQEVLGSIKHRISKKAVFSETYLGNLPALGSSSLASNCDKKSVLSKNAWTQTDLRREPERDEKMLIDFSETRQHFPSRRRVCWPRQRRPGPKSRRRSCLDLHFAGSGHRVGRADRKVFAICRWTRWCVVLHILKRSLIRATKVCSIKHIFKERLNAAFLG